MHQQVADVGGGGLVPRLRANLERQYERLLSVPSELAIRGKHFPFLPRPVDREPERALARAGMRAALPERDRKIAEALEEDGICVTTLRELALPGTDGMMIDATAMAHALFERGPEGLKPGKHNVVATGAELLHWTRVIQWALDDRLLDIVEAYLGGPAAYDCPLVYVSVADGHEGGIRTWHRDREDTRMLKVAIYLNDVDEDGGPFEILTPGLQRAIDARSNWRYETMRTATLGTRIRADDWDDGVRTVTGAAGTVIIVDTARRHHRGKPPIARDRAAVFHGYFNRQPAHPYCCERSPLSRWQIAHLAEDLPQRARDCVLWRRALPWSQKIVPRNRLSI